MRIRALQKFWATGLWAGNNGLHSVHLDRCIGSSRGDSGSKGVVASMFKSILILIGLSSNDMSTCRCIGTNACLEVEGGETHHDYG